MSASTTRVELHDASRQDYQNLHAFMEAEGFSRLIKANDGVTYHLPEAEYIKYTAETIEAVRSSAQRAANRTGRRHSVLVTKDGQWAFFNLTAVQQAAYSR